MGLNKINNKLKNVDLKEYLYNNPSFKSLWPVYILNEKLGENAFFNREESKKALASGVNPEKLYEQLFFNPDFKPRTDHQEKDSDDKLRSSISSKIKSEIQLSDNKKDLNEIIEPGTEALTNPVYDKYKSFNTESEMFYIDPEEKVLMKDDFNEDIENIDVTKESRNNLLLFDFEEKPVEEKKDLIDSFLERNRNMDPKISINQGEVEQENEDLSIPHTQRDETVLSETLAKIYVQQNKIDSAINVYKQLSLIYPEKNVYFAEIINELSNR